MVSIREVRRKIKEETERGVTGDAVIELQNRIDMLVKGLIHLADYEANKKSPRARITRDNVRLAYMTMIEKEEVVEEEDEEWGEWNEAAD
tara:strand:+ start:140 stop:409 length:270 start_codon:yes stop_codon:yes gene_type:complete